MLSICITIFIFHSLYVGGAVYGKVVLEWSTYCLQNATFKQLIWKLLFFISQLWNNNHEIMNVILTFWTLHYVDCVPFLYWFFPYCSQLSLLISKNLILHFPKNMIKQMHLTFYRLIFKLQWTWWHEMVECLY